MLKSLGTEFKVGLFTLVAVSTLGYMFFVLSPDSFDREDRKEYYTELIDAAGIITKTHVKTNGVTVGKVKSVALEASRTKIWMDISASVLIPVGSKIEVRTRGLLGDVFLEIVRAPDTGEYIKDKGFLPRSEEAVDIQALVGLMGGIAKDVKRITNSLAGVIGTDEGQSSVRNIVKNIELLSEDLRVTSGTIRKSIGEREADMQDIVSNVRDSLRDIRSFSENLKDVLDDENREKIERILASFDESMLDVKGATKNINLISQKVEKGEGTLGRLINDDTALVEIEGAVKDIREVLSPVRKLQIGVDYHGEVRNDETTQNYFNLVFRTRPDRYYIVGVTDTETSEVDRTTETLQDTAGTDEDPPTRRTRETIRETDALKINLQFAKRWYFVALRFGLFESSGGFASDFYLWGDRLRFTMEAFNFKSKENEYRHVAHLKSYASILFFNHVYAMIGVDDITRKDLETGERIKKPNWFIGAGLAFNDDDIKAIFGAAALASR